VEWKEILSPYDEVSVLDTHYYREEF